MSYSKPNTMAKVKSNIAVWEIWKTLVDSRVFESSYVADSEVFAGGWMVAGYNLKFSSPTITSSTALEKPQHLLPVKFVLGFGLNAKMQCTIWWPEDQDRWWLAKMLPGVLGYVDDRRLRDTQLITPAPALASWPAWNSKQLWADGNCHVAIKALHRSWSFQLKKVDWENKCDAMFGADYKSEES